MEKRALAGDQDSCTVALVLPATHTLAPLWILVSSPITERGRRNTCLSVIPALPWCDTEGWLAACRCPGKARRRHSWDAQWGVSDLHLGVVGPTFASSGSGSALSSCAVGAGLGTTCRGFLGWSSGPGRTLLREAAGVFFDPGLEIALACGKALGPVMGSLWGWYCLMFTCRYQTWRLLGWGLTYGR